MGSNAELPPPLASPPYVRSPALERRLRQRRADARLWLCLLPDCSLLASHHASLPPRAATSASSRDGEAAALRHLLSGLQLQFAELREEVASLRVGRIPAFDEAAPMTDPAVEAAPSSDSDAPMTGPAVEAAPSSDSAVPEEPDQAKAAIFDPAIVNLSFNFLHERGPCRSGLEIRTALGVAGPGEGRALRPSQREVAPPQLLVAGHELLLLMRWAK